MDEQQATPIQQQQHLFIFVHGIQGNADDLSCYAELLQKSKNHYCYCSKANENEKSVFYYFFN